MTLFLCKKNVNFDILPKVEPVQLHGARFILFGTSCLIDKNTVPVKIAKTLLTNTTTFQIKAVVQWLYQFPQTKSSNKRHSDTPEYFKE